ncbi:uncharacterized protein ZBAI_08147 [Zygosaccharomyces bailii ISA1307]|nr:uncharacterized protein ZBAI_08147 [Zygosaccharomyces bailii ISA1307]
MGSSGQVTIWRLARGPYCISYTVVGFRLATLFITVNVTLRTCRQRIVSKSSFSSLQDIDLIFFVSCPVKSYQMEIRGIPILAFGINDSALNGFTRTLVS